ncbi:MAG TPA: PDZ domain-containing protein [Pyrinomonadaceae bacterium]|jgi:predicted metalloprotease with PDZ domain|nr:PDZ domain-containing protein [Pyrinomonadaceae bacterium]
MYRFKLAVLRLLATGFLVCSITGVAFSQEQPLHLKYWLGMSRPASHLFEVTIEVELPSDSNLRSLDFQMPKWSPGRYAVFDFAKNVQEVKAREACPAGLDCTMPDSAVTRVDDQTWRVDLINRHTGMSLMFSYKVFGNDLSGTFSQLDARHANINGGCVFMYVVNHKQDPVTLSINAPNAWHIVNAATMTKDQSEFRFANWDMLIDMPTEIAPDWTEDDFKADDKDYRVIVHSFANEGGKRPALVHDIEKIVRAETAMWGQPEFRAYTFLITFANDGHSSDGMEHLNSTQIIEPGALADANMYEETLDAIAHEFFHVWNVKRLRPIELGPWDFTHPANTRGLWIAEGITNYYGHLMQRRAGIFDDKKFFSVLAGQIAEIENAPGSKFMSAEESSLEAPFLDDAPHAQQTNLANTSVSYYPKGETLGLVLDLLIRENTHGKASLDDVMRAMYDEFYLQSPTATYYLRGRGYTNDDFASVVSKVAGFDMSGFFKRYVRGVERPPYEQALSVVGLRLLRTGVAPVGIGVTGDEDEPANFKIAAIRSDSPAAAAGLQVGDIIFSLGGVKLTPDNFFKVLGRYKPGDRVSLSIGRDGRVMNKELTLEAPQVFDYRIEADPKATPEAKALRAAWLGDLEIRMGARQD